MEQKLKDILLYGMSADIFQAFVHHDISPREVSEFIKENKDRKDSLTHVFRLACIEGRIDVADKLFHITSTGLRNDAFYLSATAGQLSSLTYLVGKGVDPKHENSRSLSIAAANGFADCVEYLIPNSDVSAYHWKPIKEAVTNNHIECVKLLAPVSDLKYDNSRVLWMSASRGFTEIVKFLIPLCEPKRGKSKALVNACKGKHVDCIEALYPVSNVKQAHQQLESNETSLLEAEMLRQKHGGRKRTRTKTI